MKLLNKKQIKEIRKMQKALDERIRKEKNISDEQDLSLEKFLALKTELFEFVNEIESFKYWKENKGKDHILEEACDTLHFIFSIAIDNDEEIDLSEFKIMKDKFESMDTNELLGLIDAMISDAYAEKQWVLLNGVVFFLLIVLDRSGFNANDLYNAYISKNKVNHERQDNKY